MCMLHHCIHYMHVPYRHTEWPWMAANDYSTCLCTVDGVAVPQQLFASHSCDCKWLLWNSYTIYCTQVGRVIIAWKEPVTTTTRRFPFDKTSSNERMGLPVGPDVILAVTSGTSCTYVVKNNDTLHVICSFHMVGLPTITNNRTECWSQGRARLRVFRAPMARKRTQLSPF